MKSLLLFLAMCVLLSPQSAIADDTVVADKQYNQVWNGLVYANMNERYHTKRAVEEDDRSFRWLASVIAIVSLTLPIFLETYFDKEDQKWRKIKPVLYAFGIVAFIAPGMFKSETEAIQQVVQHQTHASRWNSLASQWQESFDELYWESDPISAERISMLQQQQVDIDNSEQDLPDETLLALCQAEATNFLQGTLQRKN